MKISISSPCRLLCLAIALSGFAIAGCENRNPAATPTGNPDVTPNENLTGPVGDSGASTDRMTQPAADDHEHGHEHGEHGGEIVELQPGDLDVEWTHDADAGTFVMWVETFETAGKEIERAEVRVIGAGDPKVYVLEKAEDGTYTANNAEMVTAIDAAGGEQEALQAELVVVSEGTEHRGRLINMHH